MFKTKIIFAITFTVCYFSKYLHAQTPSNCSSLFFSEYFEPSGGNSKALEIYNASSNTISLSGVQIHKFTNGSVIASIFNLSGSINSNGTYVMCNNLSDTVNVLPLADTASSFFNFNGDDALMLISGTDTLDIFGKIGQDPGTGWVSTDSLTQTLNMVLRRKASVQVGVTSNPATFQPDAQWNPFVWNDYSGLGSHVMDPCCDVTSSFTQSNNRVCVGTTVQFTSTSTGTVLSYNWLKDGVPQSTNQNTSILFSSAGSFTISHITFGSSCSLTSSVTIIVDPLPLVTITSSDSIILCPGSTVTLTSSPAITYNWSTLELTQSISVSVSGTYNVTVTDINGCVNSKSASILPTIPVNAGNDLTYCVNNGPFTLTPGSPIGGTWSGLGILNPSTGNINPSGLNGKLMYIYTAGCSDTVEITYIPALIAPIVTCSTTTNTSIQWAWMPVFGVDSYQINLGSLWETPSSGATGLSHAITGLNPGDKRTILVRGVRSLGNCIENGPASTPQECVASFCIPINTFLSPNVSICTGGSTSVTLTSITRTDFGGTFTWIWSDAGLTANQYGPFTVTPSNTKTYYLSVTDLTQPACPIKVDSVKIDVINMTGSVTTSNNVTCFGGNNGKGFVTFSGATGPFTFVWSPMVSFNDTLKNVSAGSYNVSVTMANSPKCSIVQTVVITEPTEIIVSTASTKASCQTCKDGSATANVSGGVAPYFYQWSSVPQQTNATATGLSAGKYLVSVTDTNGCNKTDSVIVDFITGNLNTNTFSETIKIYPNPVTQNLSIEIDNPNKTLITLSLHNIIGQQLDNLKFTDNKEKVFIQFNFNDLSENVYLLKIETSESVRFHKVLVVD